MEYTHPFHINKDSLPLLLAFHLFLLTHACKAAVGYARPHLHVYLNLSASSPIVNLMEITLHTKH